MKISYIHGVCVQNDAISNSIRDEITWLMSVPGNEIRLFAYACDFEELPFLRVENLGSVAFDSFFQQSDLVVFHFGVFYPLFNLLMVAPKGAKKVVVFHNITPKEHVSTSSHDVIDKSFTQMSNMAFATHVICDSKTNQDVLHEAHINVPNTVLPLAVPGNPASPVAKPSFADGLARIVFVGRFVQSKGPIDLLTAAEAVLSACPDLHMAIDFVGNLNFSDQDVLVQMRLAIDALLNAFSERLAISVHGSAPEPLKNRLLADADLFVLPTRHEGFCVPILEAFKNGCRVIAYDNSNVTNICAGLAALVPTGDTSSLARAMATELELIRSDGWMTQGGYQRYRGEVADHYNEFLPEEVSKRFLSLIAGLVNSRC